MLVQAYTFLSTYPEDLSLVHTGEIKTALLKHLTTAAQESKITKAGVMEALLGLQATATEAATSATFDKAAMLAG